MSTTAAMRDERKRLIDEQRRLLQPVIDGKRAMTGEEREKIEQLDQAIEGLKATIDAAEKLETAERAYVPETQRPAPTTAAAGTEDQAKAYRTAFWRQMRHGQAGLGPDELRVMAVGTDTSGGYTVPDEFRRELVTKLDELNIMRRYATIVQTNSGTLTIPVITTRTAAAWKAENAAYAEDTPVFTEVTLTPYKATVLLKVSEELLNDSAFPMETFVVNEFARALAELEETAFVNGNGSSQPTGVVGGSALGKTASATNAITAAELVDLYHSLPRPYRPRATWLMKDATISAIRQLTTGVSGDKTFLWQPGLGAGEPDTLLGRPVISSADMPAMTTGLKPVVFGDLSYYYIAERPGMSLQRLVELYAANGHIGFRIFKRVDGEVVTNDAIKHLILA